MSVEGINQVLARMQAMQEMAASGKTTVDGAGLPLGAAGVAAGQKSTGVDFGEVLKQAVREVTKLRATVVAQAPGSLPNDGKVIEDARSYQ